MRLGDYETIRLLDYETLRVRKYESMGVCLCLILSCETFLLRTSLGTALGATNPVQLFLLVLLECLYAYLKASLTGLGASWVALGGVSGALGILLEPL